MEKVLPFKRNYLEEAYKIAGGDETIKLRKEHVSAAIETLVGLARETTGLRNLMKKAYQEACTRRQEMGLPIPPQPKSLFEEMKFPWK